MRKLKAILDRPYDEVMKDLDARRRRQHEDDISIGSCTGVEVGC